MSVADTRVQLRPQERRIVQDILAAKIPERDVLVFGSRAGGRAKPYSDLDLAILGSEALPLARMAELREAFQESDLPFKVDLVDWNSIEEGFRTIIQRRAVRIQNGL